MQSRAMVWSGPGNLQQDLVHGMVWSFAGEKTVATANGHLCRRIGENGGCVNKAFLNNKRIVERIEIASSEPPNVMASCLLLYLLTIP